MVIKFCLIAYLVIQLFFVSASFNQAYASQKKKPKVLLFSSIDAQYLSDSLEWWGNDVGVNGFMLSYVAQWWSNKSESFKDLYLLKKINVEGRHYGIDSNFIKIALGYRELPLWTDENAWVNVLDNFRGIAEFIRESGTIGIALDTEPYQVSLFDSGSVRFKSINRDILKSKVYQRGKQIMQVLTEVYPDIEVIILLEGAFYWFNPKQGIKVNRFELWIDFFNGMASVKNNKGIVVAGERTYSVTDIKSLKELYSMIDNTMIEHAENFVFWRDRCSIALGMWPLGKEYNNKAARYSASAFKEQFSQAVMLSQKYVWIYGHGAAWFQLKKEEADKYTNDGRRIWGKEYQMLPPDPNIDKYYSVIKNYKNGR